MILNLALSRIFDPILEVFDFPSQKTFAAIVLCFLKKITWEESHVKGSRVQVAHPHPKISIVFTSPPPWHGALFQAPPANLMPLIYLGCRLSW